MTVELSPELLAYHAFVKSTLSKGGNIDKDATPAAFLEYQQQLNQLRTALQPATDRFLNGDEAAEIDIDQIVADTLQNRPHQGNAS